jgi:hypothetical protein
MKIRGKVDAYKAGSKYFGNLIWGKTMHEAEEI